MRFQVEVAPLALWLAFAGICSPLHAQFGYETNNDTITITRGSEGCPSGAVIIPATINGLPVTSIEDWAFNGCSFLTSLTIPDSVTSIGDRAFSLCTSLTHVTIGRGVSLIGNGAFIYCTNLTNVTIPGSLTRIAPSAFDQCLSLTSVTIPDNVTSIGNWAFARCSGLTNVTIGNSVSLIGSNAFEGCISLASVILPNRVTRIENRAFAYCNSLNSAYFQGNAPEVEEGVFDNSDNARLYYLPGTTGWSSSIDDRPTALWHLPHPLILSLAPEFGLQFDGYEFGFRISWATNADVVIEAALDLNDPTWLPLGTNTITMGIHPAADGWSYFSDFDWADHPSRLYRLRVH